MMSYFFKVSNMLVRVRVWLGFEALGDGLASVLDDCVGFWDPSVGTPSN